MDLFSSTFHQQTFLYWSSSCWWSLHLRGCFASSSLSLTILLIYKYLSSYLSTYWNSPVSSSLVVVRGYVGIKWKRKKSPRIKFSIVIHFYERKPYTFFKHFLNSSFEKRMCCCRKNFQQECESLFQISEKLKGKPLWLNFLC